MILTLLPNPASSQPARVTAPEWWISWVHVCSVKYGVDPNFALAVAETESSCKGQQIRFGKMGKGTFYGPFGIHRCFLKKWDIDDPMVNTMVGIQALARYKDHRKTLQKYNAEFNEAYFQRVKFLERRNREARVFEHE
ncbi:MAG: hypothetical protein ACLQED_04030 [Desulfobaccales bacterium]